MHPMKSASRFILFFLIIITGKSFGQEFPENLTTDLFDQVSSSYYVSNPIPFDQDNPKNLHYRVQVGSFSKEVDPINFKNYYPVSAINHDKIKRYYIGLFVNYSSAVLAREILVEAGFSGAFLVAFNKGKEISLSKAIEMDQLYIPAASTQTKHPSSDVRVVLTPMPSRKEERVAVLDSSKLEDDEYYLDYFFYEFQNSTPVSGLNSDAEEIMPIAWSGDSIMSFVRVFDPENIGGLKSGHDAWIAKKENDAYVAKSPFTKINTKYNDALVGVSKDNKRVYLLNLYLEKESKRGLSMIEFSGGQWSEPQDVAIPYLPFVGDFYGMYVHPEEDVVLVSMQGKDSYGMNDIYIIEKDNNGNWGELQHLDSTINTDGNDISPFLSKEKKIFIYSTDGMGGMGGNDLIIFKKLDSTWTSWSEAQNVGIEVNTPRFEAYPFIINKNLYYSSVSDSGLADIYHADIVNKMVMPIEDYLVMEDSLLFTYNVELGVLSNSEEEDINLESIPVLAMVNTDSRIDMIFFDYDRSNLKPSFTRFLNELESILENNPDISLDLRGHTDSIGTLAYNYVLGENRAASVKDYLISIGVSPSRMQVASFGKEIPIASNETAFGRAKNRRVEIRFIRKEEVEKRAK